MSGTLYIVATPIGNLADITLRALSTLKEVDLIAAEDTRVTRNLLSHFGIGTPTTSYHLHSRERKEEQLISELLEGKSIALVSDAGTPGISDPGEELIALAIAEGIPVVPIPGPSAIVTALSVSGLPTRRFAFEGFPPRKGSDRRALFEQLAGEERTLVFYESPHRLSATLKEMLQAFGDRRIAACRELTKVFEEVFRGRISEALAHFDSPRGEFVLVMEGCERREEEPDIEEALRRALAQGMTERDAVRYVAENLPAPKKEVYRRMLEMSRDE
ncbi:MAG: 16S rRNA (cytidine(1402)-2'-O)-methyltransferase [Armatimonadota bacterium]